MLPAFTGVKRVGLKHCVMAAMLLCTVLCAQSMAQSENDFNDALCRTIGGTRETRHDFTYGERQQGYVLADCETELFVIQGGLDRRSSRDILQHVLFLGALTGKSPAVVIYDTDGRIGEYEHRTQVATEQAGALFLRLRPGDLTDREWLGMVLGR